MAKPHNQQELLTGFRVLEVGSRLASSVSARLFAELGADVIKIRHAGENSASDVGQNGHGDVSVGGAVSTSQHLGKRIVDLDLQDSDGLDEFKRLAVDADLIVSGFHPTDLKKLSLDADSLRSLNPNLVITYITPFGLTGPLSEYLGPDLVIFHSSGLSKSLIGPVENPETTPPVRASGQQSEFIAGVAAACSAMFGIFRKEETGQGAVIDVSMQEALAFMDIISLSAASFGKPGRPRKLESVQGPNLTLLPASDGHIAISPREERQWKNFLKLLGSPDWGSDPKFADRTLRQENAKEIIGLLSEWSSKYPKLELFHLLQENHIPCFPMMNPAEHLDSEQLKARDYFDLLDIGPQSEIKVPGRPFRISKANPDATTSKKKVGHESSADISWLERSISNNDQPVGDFSRDNLPLKGVRVADLSWVIAGPTCTRYLASMGAEVVKVETSSRPDPGRVGQLHDVLGQGKLGITLNLKSEDGLAAIKTLVAKSDIIVENFAPGVMERLGLGWDVLKEINPKLVMISASGTGQSGPTRHYAAYGTLLQIYTGFAGLNGYPENPPSIGMAWADPLCGMLLAHAAVAALRSSRNTSEGSHIDFSMVEAVLATMPGPLIEYQLTGDRSERSGNTDENFYPHGVFKALGDDSWVAIAVTDQDQWRTLAKIVDAPADLMELNLEQRRQRSDVLEKSINAWISSLAPEKAMEILQEAGVPASASFTSEQLTHSDHLNERGFFEMLDDRNGESRLLPTLPWHWDGDITLNFGRPPDLGGDTRFVLRSILGYSDEDIDRMEKAGALT